MGSKKSRRRKEQQTAPRPFFSVRASESLRPYDLLTIRDEELFSVLFRLVVEPRDESSCHWARLLAYSARKDSSTGTITALLYPNPLPMPPELAASGLVTVERVYRTDAEIAELIGGPF